MVNKINLVYKDLSYKIVGILYEVFNELGYGYQEKYYEKVFGKLLKREKINYQSQVRSDLEFEGEKIGIFFLDFLIEGKVIVELKVGKRFSKQAFSQIISYLKDTDKKLGILAAFSPSGVRFVRIVNLNDEIKIEDVLISYKIKKMFKY